MERRDAKAFRESLLTREMMGERGMMSREYSESCYPQPTTTTIVNGEDGRRASMMISNGASSPLEMDEMIIATSPEKMEMEMEMRTPSHSESRRGWVRRRSDGAGRSGDKRKDLRTSGSKEGKGRSKKSGTPGSGSLDRGHYYPQTKRSSGGGGERERVRTKGRESRVLVGNRAGADDRKSGRDGNKVDDDDDDDAEGEGEDPKEDVEKKEMRRRMRRLGYLP